MATEHLVQMLNGMGFNTGIDLPSLQEAMRECLEMLGQAVAELKESRREVVERTLLGQKVREICAATGKSPASVSGLKFNAFVQLRKRLTALGFMEKCGELFGLAAEGADA